MLSEHFPAILQVFFIGLSMVNAGYAYSCHAAMVDARRAKVDAERAISNQKAVIERLQRELAIERRYYRTKRMEAEATH